MIVKRKHAEDEVILEVRKVKDDLARLFDYDIRRILDDARARQKTSGRRIISPPPKTNNEEFVFKQALAEI